MEEVLHIGQAAAAHDLCKIVHKHMGNIVIAGVEAAEETTQALKRIQVVFLAIHQANAGFNVKGHVRTRLDADHAAVFGLRGTVNEVNKLLCLAGTVCPHDQSNHKKSLLCLLAVVLLSIYHTYSGLAMEKEKFIISSSLAAVQLLPQPTAQLLIAGLA